VTETVAVQADWLAEADPTSLTGQPLCPACKVGYLHPYRVVVSLRKGDRAWHGADSLVGWVAVCEGNAAYNRAARKMYADAETEQPSEAPEHPPCGFVLPMTPQRHASVG
jgi:hypothetical protein